MKKKVVNILLGIAVVGLAVGIIYLISNKKLISNAEKEKAKEIEKQVDSVLAQMTIREKVAQLVFIQTDSYSQSSKHRERNEKLIEEGIGGMLILQDNLPRFVARMNELQEMAKVPLLVSIDGEWGPSMRFDEFPFFPQQMQLGALRDEKLIYKMGQAVAEQCKMVNIHINYAPVVDINNNPSNPVINTRSFGEDRDNVARKAKAYMQGMQDGGIVACSKHFPGHGDTNVDSHKGLPVLPFDRNRLDSLELYPFRDQIKNGVKMVMIGHLRVPALDKDISSISYPIVTGLLREEMGFDGLIVSDALTMKGVSASMRAEEVALAAYKAGVEILLQPGNIEQSIDRIEEAIKSGECSVEDLDKRVKKVLRMKAEMGMLDKQYTCQIDTNGISERVKKDEHMELSQLLSDKSMTLVNKKSKNIPLRRGSRIAYIGYNAQNVALQRKYGDIEGLSGYTPVSGMVDSTTLMYQYLQKTLSARDCKVHYFALNKNSSRADISKVEKELADYDVVILACHSPDGYSRKNLISNEHKYALSPLVSKYHPILVHFGSPYGISSLAWQKDVSDILVAYQDSENNQYAAARVLTGEIEAEGKLPVGI